MDLASALRPARHRALPLLLGGLLVTQSALAETPVVTQYSYNPGDDVVTVTDPRGLVTTYTHDGLGQLWQQVSPDTGTTSFASDSYGRRISMTRADGVRTTYSYDGIGRVTVVSAGGKTQDLAYDNCTNGTGRLCTASDTTGATSYSYTPEGWVSGRGFAVGASSYAIGYGHDKVGHVTTVSYPDGNRASYSYTNGVVSGIALTVGGTVLNGATAVTYQPMNEGMTSWTSSNGLFNRMAYDTDGRLTSINATGVERLSLTYDSANRITQLTNGMNTNLTQNFGYDAMSRLVSVYSSAENESYQYDADGNRITQAVNGASSIHNVSATSNQIINTSGAALRTYGYDAKGNTTTLSSAPTYSYDPFNRLSSAGGMNYYVNPEGQRLRKSGAAGTTLFAPDQGGAMLAENPGGGWIDYVWLNGRLIGRISGGTVDAVHADQTGRPEEVTDAAQAVVWRAQNYPFTQQVTTASMPFNLGFPGQYYDAETGNWNNGFRDYNSALGRYIESDPIGLGGGINTYAYVEGDPISNVDPLGLGTFALGGAASGQILAMGSISLQVSISWNSAALGDLSQWRLGGIFTVAPLTMGSTGVGGSAGVLATYSPTNNVSTLNGWSPDHGASGGAAIVGGYDMGNPYDPCNRTHNFFLGAGLKISGAVPVEAHTGVNWTAAGSFSL